MVVDLVKDLADEQSAPSTKKCVGPVPTGHDGQRWAVAGRNRPYYLLLLCDIDLVISRFYTLFEFLKPKFRRLKLIHDIY